MIVFVKAIDLALPIDVAIEFLLNSTEQSFGLEKRYTKTGVISKKHGKFRVNLFWRYREPELKDIVSHDPIPNSFFINTEYIICEFKKLENTKTRILIFKKVSSHLFRNIMCLGVIPFLIIACVIVYWPDIFSFTLTSVICNMMLLVGMGLLWVACWCTNMRNPDELGIDACQLIMEKLDSIFNSL